MKDKLIQQQRNQIKRDIIKARLLQFWYNIIYRDRTVLILLFCYLLAILIVVGFG